MFFESTRKLGHLNSSHFVTIPSAWIIKQELKKGDPLTTIITDEVVLVFNASASAELINSVVDSLANAGLLKQRVGIRRNGNGK